MLEVMENSFAIERSGKAIDDLIILDENGEIAFEDVMNMSCEDVLENNERIQEFIIAVMDSTNAFFEEEDDDTAVTLIGPDGVFIWGAILIPDGEGGINYQFINWQEDGQIFKYEDYEKSAKNSLTN